MQHPICKQTVPEPIVQSTLMQSLPGIAHGFSSRLAPDGTSNCFSLGAEADDGTANRTTILRHLNMPGHRLCHSKQVHGHRVIEITAQSLQEPIPEGDALVTQLPQTPLMVLTADCVPILLADARQKVVAAIHAGWRGTAQEIVRHTIEVMRHQYHSNPEDIWAAIGPSIGPCCYEVGPEVHQMIRKQLPQGEPLFETNSSKIHFNLWKANILQLFQAGVPPHQTDCIERCTRCAPKHFFSVRASGASTGRQGAFVMIQ